MNDWDIRLVDYWDQTKNAINNNILQLSKLSEPGRMAAFDQIRDSVRKRSESLADEYLLQAVVSMVDDIYKCINEEALISQTLFDYLDAFGRTLTTVVSERGYVIRYVVENQFPKVDFLMQGPLDVFPKIFNAAGFLYICPQQAALFLMQHDGINAEDYMQTIARYIAEARYLTNEMVTRCVNEDKHFVFLEADYQEGVLDLAFQDRGAPGVLSIFRNEAPVAGSEVSIGFPEDRLGG